METNIFLPYDLDRRVWPNFEYFNLIHNIRIVNARALIIHMSISCDNISFLLVLNLLTLTFDLFFFYLTLVIISKKINYRHGHFLWQDLSTGIKIYVLVILAIFGIAHYSGPFVFHIDILFYPCFLGSLDQQ